MTKKSTKRPNEQFARMKMDSSKVHRYFQLNHSLDGYLIGDSLAPKWLNEKLRWDSKVGNFYYLASDGCETMIPNHSFIVEFEKSEWPLIIFPDGFEADWFPLSPGDDGYDVLATDNAITREEGESLARQYAYDETGDSINTRSNDAWPTHPAPTEPLDPATNSEDCEASPDSLLSESQQDLVRLIAQQVFKELSVPPMIRVPDSEAEEIQRVIKESSLGPLVPYKSYMDTERDASYQNGYDKGFVDGQKQAFQSVRKALRTSGLFATQSPESEPERPSGEKAAAPTEEDLRRFRQHGYEPDSGEEFARAIKQYPTDRSRLKPFI